MDAEANRRTCAVIRALEARIARDSGRRALAIAGMVVGFLAAVGVPALLTFWDPSPPLSAEAKAALGALAAAGLGLGLWLVTVVSGLGKGIERMKARRDAEERTAWAQMEPLNALYTWDLSVNLIEATVPRLEFDPYFSSKRLKDLGRLYGLTDEFNAGRSVLFAQSGVINGNPFVFGEYLEQSWGTETYHGSITISWQERERDERGRTRWVTRFETLTASVTKPAPLYATEKILIYGNDAAPDLTFTHVPSGLDSGGVFTGLKKMRRLHKLRAFSRNLDDDSQFTMMSNEEFETWFHTPDRNHEVQYRVLFSALAQRQLLALMKDTETGFGDDFTFEKDHKLNRLRPEHLQSADLDTPPERYRDYDLDRAEATFRNFNETDYRDLYFSLAPLMAIPAYQQTRTHEDIWKIRTDAEGSSFWEHESLANYYGDRRLGPKGGITQSIFKTAVLRRRDGVSDVEVTAHAFRGVKHVEHCSVFGGDGKWHDVPVEWTEYVPVERRSVMVVAEEDLPHEESNAEIWRSMLRRSIRSYV